MSAWWGRGSATGGCDPEGPAVEPGVPLAPMPEGACTLPDLVQQIEDAVVFRGRAWCVICVFLGHVFSPYVWFIHGVDGVRPCICERFR